MQNDDFTAQKESVFLKEGSDEAADVDRSNENAASLEVGQRQLEALGLENYEVLELLGQGGMGSVYKVRDKQLNKTLAIKVLRKELAADRQAVRRFELEASAASELTHMNLVPVYGNGQTDQGLPYLIMDYVDGESLSDVLRFEKKLAVSRSLDIFMQTCEALSHAHMKGVIHRDLKPSNIMITKTTSGGDIIHLLDFGIAKILPNEATDGEKTNLTQTGEVFGSPLYMSPEQCQNNPQDKRSDIYALGCLMYETVTGVQPFAAENPVKIILKHLGTDPEPPGSLSGAQEIPKDLETIILKCLEKEPKDRYQSVDTVLADLRSVNSGGKISTKLKPRKKQVKQLSTKSKYLWATAVAVFLGVSLALVSAGGKLYDTYLNPYSDAQTFDNKSYGYFVSGQYEKAIPLLEFGISAYRDQVDAARKAGDNTSFARNEILLTENIQHVGKCYLELAKKAEANKKQSEANSLYEKARERYAESIEIWRKYRELERTMAPEAFTEYAIVLNKLGLTNELEQLKALAKQKNIAL